MTRAHTKYISRRTLVRGFLTAGLLTGATVGCASASTSNDDRARGATATEPTPEPTAQPPLPKSQGSVLLAYFSRPGENYHYGDRVDLEVGNTEVLAEMIRDRIDCAVHRIEAADPYPHDYDATVQRNTQEQVADARPAIANPLPDLTDYDIVLLASPIWNVRLPMIMRTFAEALDFTGTIVHPITTHAMSGLGTTERDYADACTGATLGEGLAVRGEQVADAGRTVDAWLARIGRVTAPSSSVPSTDR